MKTDSSVYAQFNDTYKPIMDGVGVCAENYARWLTRKYRTTWIVAPKVGGYTDREEFPVLRFPSIPLPSMKPYRIGLPWLDPHVRKNLNETEFALIHAHCPFVSGRLALGIARSRGVPFIATFHTKYHDDFSHVLRNKRLVARAVRGIVDFYSAADAVWAPNNATALTLRGYGYTGEIEIMPNGTDLVIPDEPTYAEFRRVGAEAIGVDDDVTVFLFVGQHRWEKNVGLIIDALIRLSRTKTRFRMVFAGEGYAADEMRRRCRPIRDHVKFLGVVLDRDVLKSLYARADLFLFPSLYDNAPLVMREAAAYSCPAVLAEGSSAAEGFCDGDAVFLTPNDPDALATRLQMLACDPILRHRVGERAKEVIYLTWESVVDEVSVRYDEMIAVRRPAPQ